MFRRDISIGKDPEHIYKTAYFNDAIKRKRDGSPLFPSGSRVFICMTSDFFYPGGGCVERRDMGNGEAEA